jgi:outer membrane receptor protein involved in Fe transport
MNPVARRSILLASTVMAGILMTGAAQADGSEPPPALSDPVESLLGPIQLSGRIEAGVTFNPATPTNGINFGRLFTDKADQPVLNQFALTVERDIDPNADRFQLGFKIQATYGMDSQFIHYFGIDDQGTTARNSFDPIEISLEAHAPVITHGGIDVKAGLFPTPMGHESIDPTRNFFYSKSYIFNFGLPRTHTGILTTTHVNAVLDLYAGYTTGVNTSFGSGGGYNDGQPHVLGGFGLNFPRLTILALTHIGPEDPLGSLPANVPIHAQKRYLNDVVATWKVNDKLTSVTELNYIRDDGLKADGGGVAEYLSYPLSREVTAGLRAEVWRDAKGVFVAGYPGNLDYIDAEEGLPNRAYGPGPETYGEVTLGLNIKPGGLPRSIEGLTIRPELRYDRDLAGAPSFGGRPLSAKDQVTVGADVVVPLLAARDDREPWPESGPLSGEDADGRAPNAQRIARPDHRALMQDDAVAPTGFATLAIHGENVLDQDWDRVGGANLVVDGVTIGSHSTQIIDPFDLASVQTDAGPSNIIDGEDSVRGLVTVSRTKPTRAWGLDLEYGLEQGYHANAEKVLFNMPVGDAAGLKISVSHQGRGGYLNNIYVGDGLYGRDELTTGNLQFDWSITPALEANFGLTLTHQDGQGSPLALGDRLDAQLGASGQAPLPPGARFNPYGSPYVPGATVPLGAFQTANDLAESSLLTSQIYSLQLDYVAPIAKITTITAFIKQNDQTRQDLDGGCGISDIGGRPCAVLPNPLTGYLQSFRPEKFDEFTETVRAEHDFSAVAKATVGFSYYHDDTNAVTVVQAGDGGVAGVPASSTQTYGQTRDDKSVFARLSVDPVRRLHFAAEGRFVDDQTDYRQSVQSGPAGVAGPLIASVGSRTDRKLLSKFTASFDLTDSSVLYAERATGFRSGGLPLGATLAERIPGQSNFDPAHPNADVSAYAPETDTRYEIGSENHFLSDQISVNLVGFLERDRGRQVTQIVLTPGYAPGFDTYVINLPRVDIKGVDLDLGYRPDFMQGLTLSAQGVYQDARITDGRVPGVQAPVNLNATAGAPGSVYDLTGVPLERTPEFSASARADYRMFVVSGILDLDVGYRWTSRYSFGELAAQPDYQPAFGLVDLSIIYRRSFYTLSASVKNLTNQIYFRNASAPLFIHDWGDPRTAVVELQASF